jgi:hypothetical protein
MTLETNIRKILKEETQDIDMGVLNFLRRRYEVKEVRIGDETDENPILLKVIEFKGTDYSFTTFRSKKEMTQKIYNMLQDYAVIQLGEYNPNVFNADKQKVVRAIRVFLNEILK